MGRWVCACGLFDEPPTFAGANCCVPRCRGEVRGEVPALCCPKDAAPGHFAESSRFSFRSDDVLTKKVLGEGTVIS